MRWNLLLSVYCTHLGVALSHGLPQSRVQSSRVRVLYLVPRALLRRSDVLHTHVHKACEAKHERTLYNLHTA